MNDLYIIIGNMNTLKNLFLTSSLSFILGFYSLCHIFIYFKRIEYAQQYNRKSFFQLNNTFEDIEIKFNKLQYEVVCLKDELSEIRDILSKLTHIDNSFISPVSSSETLDLSDDEIICDELCNINEKYIVPSKITSYPTININVDPSEFYNPQLVDDSHIEFSEDDELQKNYNENIIPHVTISDNSYKSVSLETKISQSTSNSIESINKLKSILGYQLVNTDDFSEDKCIVRSFSLSHEEVELNKIIPEDKESSVSSKTSRVKRSHSVSDVNWVGLTKKFIFG
jgi:hypothetical protein